MASLGTLLIQVEKWVNPPETLASFLAVKISQMRVPFLHLPMDIGIVLSAGSVRKH